MAPVRTLRLRAYRLRALAHEIVATAHRITRGAPRLRVHAGLRQHPATQQRCDLVRIDPIILGFAAVDGTHVQRMPQHERHQLGQ